MAERKHLKFVGWVEAIDTVGNVWTQRVVESSTGLDGWIDWTLTKLPLDAKEGHYVSVHRTKAGRWYVVNLSVDRMPCLTESQMKRVDARVRRMQRWINTMPEPTRG